MGKQFSLRNGNLLLSTEAPGGIYSSSQLKRIAALCDEESVIVRATEDQRLALFVPEDRAPAVAKELKQLGLGIRHYQDGLHQPVACIGDQCPMHEQNALGAAMAMTQKLSSITVNSPLKIGINGCGQCCVPTHTLDVSIVGEASGYRISLGGKTAMIPEMASYAAESVPAERLPDLIANIISQFNSLKEDGETLQQTMERVGTSPFIKLLHPYSQDAGQGDEGALDFAAGEVTDEAEIAGDINVDTDGLEQIELTHDFSADDIQPMDTSLLIEEDDSIQDSKTIEEIPDDIQELEAIDEIEQETSQGDLIPEESLPVTEESLTFDSAEEIPEAEELPDNLDLAISPSGMDFENNPTDDLDESMDIDPNANLSFEESENLDSDIMIQATADANIPMTSQADNLDDMDFETEMDSEAPVALAATAAKDHEFDEFEPETLGSGVAESLPSSIVLSEIEGQSLEINDMDQENQTTLLTSLPQAIPVVEETQDVASEVDQDFSQESELEEKIAADIDVSAQIVAEGDENLEDREQAFAAISSDDSDTEADQVVDVPLPVGKVSPIKNDPTHPRRPQDFEQMDENELSIDLLESAKISIRLPSGMTFAFDTNRLSPGQTKVIKMGDSQIIITSTGDGFEVNVDDIQAFLPKKFRMAS